ncbi:hypothetical protein V5O48_012811 [Marasmius crinis-equi]|uniref:Uncharacterized protein n=1 Tax=Marasmius crinis-equi TaxID=585013 RepID=A0ABR3F1S8_9AGAR
MSHPASLMPLNQENWENSNLLERLRACGHQCPHPTTIEGKMKATSRRDFTFPNHNASGRSFETNHLGKDHQAKFHPYCNSECNGFENMQNGTKSPSLKGREVTFYMAARGILFWGVQACKDEVDPNLAEKSKALTWWRVVKAQVAPGPWKDFILAINKDTPTPLWSPFVDGGIGVEPGHNWSANLWRKQYQDLWFPARPAHNPRNSFSTSAALAFVPGIAEPHLHGAPPTSDLPHPLPDQIPKCPIAPSSSFVDPLLSGAAPPDAAVPGHSHQRSLASPLASPFTSLQFHPPSKPKETVVVKTYPEIIDITSAMANLSLHSAPRIVWAINGCDGEIDLAKPWHEAAAEQARKCLYFCELKKLYDDDTRDVKVRAFLLELRTNPKHPARRYMYPEISGLDAKGRGTPNWKVQVTIFCREWLETVLTLLREGASVLIVETDKVIKQVRDQSGDVWKWLMQDKEHTLLAFGVDCNQIISKLVHPDFRRGILKLQWEYFIKVWPDFFLQDVMLHKELYPFLFQNKVKECEGHIYIPGHYDEDAMTEKEMIATLEADLAEDFVVKVSVSSDGRDVVLPSLPLHERRTRLAQVVHKHYQALRNARRQQGRDFYRPLYPYIIFQPFNHFLAHQGETRFSFVNGKLAQAIHTHPVDPNLWYPEPEEGEDSEEGNGPVLIITNAVNRLRPLEALIPGNCDLRADESRYAWHDLGATLNDGTQGFQQAAEFATAMYQHLCSLELARQGDLPVSGIFAKPQFRSNLLHVRFDITAIRLEEEDGKYIYRYSLHEIQDGCCGLFRRRAESGGVVAESVAKHLFAWALM